MKCISLSFIKKIKFIVIMLFVCLITLEPLAQNVNDYRSAQSGEWRNQSTWERWNGNSWATPNATQGVPNNSDGVITIRNLHIVNVSRNVSADQILVEEGGEIYITSGCTLTIYNGTGTDFTVNGVINNLGIISGNSTPRVLVNGTVDNSNTIRNLELVVSGVIINRNSLTGLTLTFNENSIYQHEQNGETIPTATWNVNSTCKITGVTNSITASSFGLDQTFGNFIWDCNSQTADISFAGYLRTINGNFIVNNTGSGSLRLLNGNDTRTLNVGGNFLQSAGTFYIMGSGADISSSMTLAIDGNFSLTVGTLIVNGSSRSTDAGNINVAGNFSYSSGTTITEQSNGTSNIIFNGTGVQTYTSGGTISNTVNFIVNNGSTLQMTAAGTVVTGGGSFTLLNNASLGITSPNGITSSGASGNIQVTGTRTYNAGANYIYNGTAAQVTGNGLSTTNNLIINNSAGVTLTNAVQVNGLLTLTSGKLNTSSSNLLTIGSAGTTSLGSSSNFVNGPLIRKKNTRLSQTLYFPVGKGSSFKPLELTLVHNNTRETTYQCELFNTAPPARTLPSSLGAVSSIRHWDVIKTGLASVTSASIKLHYGGDDGVSDDKNLRIAKEDGKNWIDIGGGGTGSPVQSTIPFTTFSDFVLANSINGSNPLPVELYSFTATSNKEDVLLKWITKTEIQNYGFEVERRFEKSTKTEEDLGTKKWEMIGFKQGHGNSNSPKEYFFKDDKVNAGTYYYRLKQIDNDGMFKYSSEVEVTVKEIVRDFNLEQNYPNPFNQGTIIQYSLNKKDFVKLSVYNLIGEIVTELVNEEKDLGSYSISFNPYVPGKILPSGIYVLRLKAGGQEKTIKMVYLK